MCTYTTKGSVCVLFALNYSHHKWQGSNAGGYNFVTFILTLITYIFSGSTWCSDIWQIPWPVLWWTQFRFHPHNTKNIKWNFNRFGDIFGLNILMGQFSCNIWAAHFSEPPKCTLCYLFSSYVSIGEWGEKARRRCCFILFTTK